MKKILIAIIITVLAIALSQPMLVRGNSMTVQDDGPRLFNRYLPLVLVDVPKGVPYPPPPMW